MLCYCKSLKEYDACCAPIHKGMAQANTAEELMRSRYSAFATADIDYLMLSHHVSTCPLKEKEDILNWAKSVTWIGLQIINTKAGGLLESEGWVEFKATFMENGQLGCIHENSFFVKEHGQWFYKEGQHK